METVTLTQMLEAREARAARQQVLLAQFGKPLVCLTMNIAGPVKDTPLIRRGFSLGQRRLEQQLLRLRAPILHREQMQAVTGCEAFYAVDLPAEILKAMTVELEELDEFGRLLDLDVLAPDGRKLERPQERGCLICGAAGRGCARSRRHSVEELQAKTAEILQKTLARQEQSLAAELACRALLYEACTTPKPGLVDRQNHGSHGDMDLFSFLSSSAALQNYFQTCTEVGQKTSDDVPEATFLHLKLPGKMAEGRMLQVTGGVNTHKGAIFLMGILCGALGRLGQPCWADSHRILQECAAMTRGLTAQELEPLSDAATAGQKFYLEYGLRGIRGEVEDGLPSVRNAGLPTLEQTLAEGRSLEEAGCAALLALMAVTEDTALLHRCGIDGWRQVQQQAKTLLEAGADRSALEQMDREMIAGRRSPGGSADLLAVCYLLHFLKEESRGDL